ncbi:MAG: aminotransferase class IV [Candidatus Omnitrophica bacterium]|nr:aminotransferase class IV [Candidatus Omnitrophota bacterium]
MKNWKVWINGRLRDAGEAKVSVNDRGFLYGDGVFETMRSYAGTVFKIDRHLGRLFKSLKVLKIRPSYSKETIEKAVYRTLEANGLKNAYIRLTITRGGADPTAVIIVREFEGNPAAMYRSGITVKIANTRQNEYSPLTGIKSLNFLNHIIPKEKARIDGYDDAILLNTKGDIAEGSTSNVFTVKKNELITPSISCGILPGITRSVIIEIAGRMKIKVRERCISPKELLSGDEVFLTNSLVEVLPVTKIGAKRIAGGLPGEISKLLRISYQRQVIEETIWG